MGKSHLVLLLFCSLTLNINSGFALRCYGCIDGSFTPANYPNIGFFKYTAKDPPKCSDGLGKEFDCSGSCIKKSETGTFKDKSEFFLSIQYHQNLFHNICQFDYVLCFTPYNLVQRYCEDSKRNKESTGCNDIGKGIGNVKYCYCNSDLCNDSPKPNVSVDL